MPFAPFSPSPFSSLSARRLAWHGSVAGLLIAALAACGTAPPAPPRSIAPTVTAPPAPLPPVRKPEFLRPTNGAVIGRFNGTTNKGIDFAGNAGDPVVAAADGRVVLVSDEMRAYGNLVVVSHNSTYLTAYAHLQRALVKENQVVTQGEPIGEMGMTGANRVELHFELRKQGTAVDPEPYLNGQLR